MKERYEKHLLHRDVALESSPSPNLPLENKTAATVGKRGPKPFFGHGFGKNSTPRCIQPKDVC